MPLAQRRDKKIIVLNDKIKQLLKFLDEALKSQSLENTSNFTELTEARLAEKTIALPEISVEHDGESHKLFEEYLDEVNGALLAVKYGPQHTEKEEVNNEFVVVRAILMHLVTLILSMDDKRKMWLAAYRAFAEKINQSDLLHVGYFSKTPSKFNLLLGNKEMNQELQQRVDLNDVFYSRDIKNLSAEELARRSKIKEEHSIQALRDISFLMTRLDELEKKVEVA